MKNINILIIGYNTIKEIKQKGLISDDSKTFNIWYNPGVSFNKSIVVIPFGKNTIQKKLTQSIKYFEWKFQKNNIFILNLFFIIFHLFQSSFRIYKIIKKYNIDVVKVNGPHIPSLVFFLISPFLKIPKIMFIEAFWVKLLPTQDYMNKFFKFILPYWYKFYVYRNFDIYCGTPSVDKLYFEQLGMNSYKISKWIHEIDIETLLKKTKKLIPQKKYLDLPHPKLIAVGRLHSEKHHQDLIYVLKELKNDYKNAQLILVGDGEQKQKLIDLAHKLKLNNSLHITGNLTQEEGLSLVKHCDIYVAPMQGNALIEAMISDIPIVAYNHSWHSNLITHKSTGYLVENRNPKKMAKAVKYLIENKKESKKIASNANKYAFKNFNNKEVTKILIRPYLDALGIKKIPNKR